MHGTMEDRVPDSWTLPLCLGLLSRLPLLSACQVFITSRPMKSSAAAQHGRWLVLSILLVALAAAHVNGTDVQAQQAFAASTSATQQCRKGILSADSKVCCKSSCGGCAQRVGGQPCSKGTGGAAGCCPTTIMRSNKFCSTQRASTPPCRISLCTAPCPAVTDTECQKSGMQFILVPRLLYCMAALNASPTSACRWIA